MALLRRGLDPNAATEADVALAVDDLIAMTAAADVEVSTDGAYAELQTGEYAVQQAWSGDVLAAKRFGPGTVATLSRTGYTWPDGRGRGLRSHRDLHERSQPRPGPRVRGLPAGGGRRARQLRVERLPAAGGRRRSPRRSRTRSFPWSGVVPDHLRTAVLAPDDLVGGRFLRPLAAADQAIWRVAWGRFLEELDGGER